MLSKAFISFKINDYDAEITKKIEEGNISVDAALPITKVLDKYAAFILYGGVYFFSLHSMDVLLSILIIK